MAGVTVALKYGARKRVYVYEDEYLKLEIPVPRIDVFLAFVKELDRLGAATADAEAFVTILARAFWVLHQRPRRKGLFRKRHVIPAVDEEGALKLLKEKLRRGDVAVKSLTPALFGLVKCVATGRGEGSALLDRKG